MWLGWASGSIPRSAPLLQPLEARRRSPTNAGGQNLLSPYPSDMANPAPTINAELEAVTTALAAVEPKCKRLVLFGSHARGNARPDSDLGGARPARGQGAACRQLKTRC
jgi:hypothetical protein